MADIADISNLNTYRGRQGSLGSLWYTWNIIHTGGNNSELAYSRVELDYSEKLRIGSMFLLSAIYSNLKSPEQQQQQQQQRAFVGNVCSLCGDKILRRERVGNYRCQVLLDQLDLCVSILFAWRAACFPSAKCTRSRLDYRTLDSPSLSLVEVFFLSQAAQYASRTRQRASYYCEGCAGIIIDDLLFAPVDSLAFRFV